MRIFYKVLYRTYHIELIYTFILGDFTFIFTLFAIVYQLIFVDMEVVPSINKTLSLHQQKKRSKRPRQKTNYRIKYKVQYPYIYIKLTYINLFFPLSKRIP